MANKNALNKNSVYVQSLVSFILDTKPYHSKLTEIVEEYRFFDDVSVKFKERFSSKTKISAAWTYNYFSSANPLYRTMPAQRVVSPSFTADTYIVGQDENTDLALVPYVYSKKAFDGPGVNAVYIRHPEFSEPLTESVDYFQSHGSFQFQIKQTKNANGDVDPLWSSTADDNIILESRKSTRDLALDVTNPSSAVNRIRALLDEIQAAVNSVGGHTDVQRELTALYQILNTPDLPQSYEALLAWLAIPNDQDLLVPLEAPHDREWFEQQFSNHSSPLFFGMFTDLGIRESGRVEYANVHSSFLRVSNLDVAGDREVEEWTFETVLQNSDLYRVTGSSTGFVGFVTAGESFNNGSLSFTTTKLGTPTSGDKLEVTPTRKIVISANAPLETWNLIKVNPIAHDRPQLTSPRFGNIRDLNGNLGAVTILDQSLPAGDIVLTARGDGMFFDLQSITDPDYTEAVLIGTAFNDGKLGFTLTQGISPFAKGDRFYISIENLPARAEDVELGYGYDMDPYDDDQITYPDGEKIGFYYDGRFTDYDLTSMELVVQQNAVDARKWRLRALPDYTRPIANVPGIPPGQQNLQIYYADRFSLEFSDDDFNTKTIVTNVPIGGSYANTQHGISFTLAAGSRPFVAVSADDNGPRVEGGDIFSFTVTNPYPRLIESPIGLSSLNVPRLIMHSDSFYDAPAAKWLVEFTNATTYTVSGTDGVLTYGPATGTTTTPGVMSREGLSFKDLNIHFTIVPTGGLAAGDKFTFQTFAKKPSFLVHGSVTGWTKPATVGEYYWNGKIGFKLRPPYATMFVNGLKVPDLAPFSFREDCPSIIYNFLKTSNGYQITRADTGISGFSDNTVPYSDQYITIDLGGVTEENFQLVIDANDLPLWNGADVVILNPTSTARRPTVGDHVIIEKTEDGTFLLNLVPGATNISALNPITIDQRFIDVNTRGTPLALTSPETSLFQGWIPLIVIKLDSKTSIAEFSDPTTTHVFKSASSNENVGVLRQQNPLNKDEPIVFEWDVDFFNKYLPLNAEANLVTLGTGWNDRVKVSISESVKFLLGGGALFEDWMFHDDMHVSIVDKNKWNIVTMYNDDLVTNVDDGPFGGFLAGYANVPYDGDEGYDAGQPFDLQSLLSKKNITDEEKANIFDQWDNYLETHAMPTTEQQWAFLRAALASDPNPNFITSDFGFPAVGMGMDITDRPDGEASATILEAMIILAVDKANLLDSRNYDIGKLDEQDEVTAISYSGSMPPIPTSVPAGSTYASLDTPLTVATPARVFQVTFNASPAVLAAMNPTFSIWLPDLPAPIQVAVVERIGLGVYRFSVAKPTEAKIIVG